MFVLGAVARIAVRVATVIISKSFDRIQSCRGGKATLWKSAWLPSIHLRIKISVLTCQAVLLMGAR